MFRHDDAEPADCRQLAVGRRLSRLSLDLPLTVIHTYAGTATRDGHEAGQLFILVGHADTKQWWRNVMANPDVLVEVNGRDVEAHATVHQGPDETAAHDLGVYVGHRPRVARMLGIPLGAEERARALAEAAARTVSVRIDLRAAAQS